MNFIPWSKPKIFGLEKKLVVRAINTSWISGGEYIEKLENSLSNYFKTKYAFLVSNGTAALHCSLLSLELKKGDEIIVPGYGYMAAANISKLMNLKIKFADVDLNSFCVSLSNIKKQVTKKTKVVVVTHTYGNINEIYTIKKFCRSKNIIMIEDAAESFGSKYQKRLSGAIGDIGTFSLHATKNITTGEGGLILTNSKKLAVKIKLYRSHGVVKKRYYHIVPGHNFRLTNFQAGMGLAQFKNINKIYKKRKQIYNLYKLNIKNKNIVFQEIEKKVDFIPWTLAIYFKNNQNNKIEKLIKWFEKYKIETRSGFFSADRLPIYKINQKEIPNSNFLSKNIICLPIFYDLKKKEILYICEKLNNLKF